MRIAWNAILAEATLHFACMAQQELSEACSLNGDFNPWDGSCQCYPGWHGSKCSLLKFGTAVPGRKSFVAPLGSTTWGGSPIQADDRKTYYMFVSLSRNSTIAEFSQTSVIVAAISQGSPTGPYKMLDPVHGPYLLGPRNASFFDGLWTQNPVVVRLKNGEGYCLFYAGGNQKGVHWSIGRSSIGVAFAKNLSGPWIRPDEPVLHPSDSPESKWEAGGIANPAVYVNDDNSILLAYRGKNDDGIAFAFSPSWNGSYTRLYNGSRLFINEGLEDPFLLRITHGLHMIMHNIAGDNCSNCWTKESEALDDGTCTATAPDTCVVRGLVGSLAYAPWNKSKLGNKMSPDILSWRLTPRKSNVSTRRVAGGYSLAAPFTDGSTQTFSHREEPKMLLEWSPKARDYVPTHLFNVVIDAQIPHWKFDVSYVHAQPLDLGDYGISEPQTG